MTTDAKTSNLVVLPTETTQANDTIPQESIVEAQQRLSALAQDVKARLPELSDDAQKELAKLLGLFPKLEARPRYMLLSLAEIATAALLIEKPNVGLAKELNERIGSALSHPILAQVIARSPAATVVFGLGMLLYLAIPLIFLTIPGTLEHYQQIFGIETSALFMVAIAGALGSIVSIMVRIHDFSDVKKSDPIILLLTGFFKPVIGASFAMFVFVIMKSGIIPISIQDKTANYFFLAVAFIAGFSERFATDVMSSAEKQFGSTRKSSA